MKCPAPGITTRVTGSFSAEQHRRGAVRTPLAVVNLCAIQNQKPVIRGVKGMERPCCLRLFIVVIVSRVPPQESTQAWPRQFLR